MNRLSIMLVILLPTLVAGQVEVVVGHREIVKDDKGSVAPGVLDTPFGVAFAADESMYIVEYTGGRIHKMSPDGKLEHVAGKHRTPARRHACRDAINQRHQLCPQQVRDDQVEGHVRDRIERADEHVKPPLNAVGPRVLASRFGCKWVEVECNRTSSAETQCGQ